MKNANDMKEQAKREIDKLTQIVEKYDITVSKNFMPGQYDECAATMPMYKFEEIVEYQSIIYKNFSFYGIIYDNFYYCYDDNFYIDPKIEKVRGAFWGVRDESERNEREKSYKNKLGSKLAKERQKTY